jgi:hypothetical protein
MLTEVVELSGGPFRMGSTQFYPEEAPVHTATVGDYAVERHPVTNAQFAVFVADTGYVTVAEQPLDPALYPGAAPQDLVPGALVFRPTSGPVDLRDWRQWWGWVPGASWRQPFGPDGGSSNFEDRLDHPVVQVAVFGGIGARNVGTTPYMDWSASCVGRVGADGGEDVITPGPDSPATGTPSVVLTQAAPRTAAMHSRTNVVHRVSFINPSRRPAQVPFPASHTGRRKDPR